MIDRHGPNRRAPTWAQVLNPFWLASDDERNRAWPWLLWFCINPFCNLLSVVLGISHRTRTICVAKGDGWTYTPGWNWGWSMAEESRLRLPFISYRGRWFECMIGWKTSGALGTSFRKANARNAPPLPPRILP